MGIDDHPTIRFRTVESPLGPLLVASTDKGICRLTFGEEPGALQRHFPDCEIVPDDGSMSEWVDGILRAIEAPATAPKIPVDARGSAFQKAVWAELCKIPLGETRSYAQIAAAIGKPGAMRAVGTANGSNPVSVIVPCHRVIRSDGSLGGYGGGIENKKKLLAAEGRSFEAAELPLVE